MTKRFAWLPVKVTSGQWIWMSGYYEHRDRVYPDTQAPPIHSNVYRWTETPQEQTFRLLKAQVYTNRNIWNTPTIFSETDKL